LPAEPAVVALPLVNDFERDTEQWQGAVTRLAVDGTTARHGKKSLAVVNAGADGEFKTVALAGRFDAIQAGQIAFDYRVPAGVQLSLYVRVGRAYYAIGFTAPGNANPPAGVLASLGNETPWIGALVLGNDGTLYAGTVGTATVWAIDTRNGKATKIVNLTGADHVWALAFDAEGKTLYAATGSEGKLFAIDPVRKAAKSVWQADDKHLLSLARAADGAFWIGTSEEAILYRYDPRSGEGRAISDFAGAEVKAIAPVGGGVIVAVNDFDSKPQNAPAPKK
jgi:streptogramin lyase